MNWTCIGRGMRRTARAISLVALLAGCGERRLEEPPAPMDLRAALAGADLEGFARATEPPAIEFPRDLGPHEAFAVEWWYWTGNVEDAAGRPFGFELVFFRRALAPPAAAQRPASLAEQGLVLAHAAVTDVAGRRFLCRERLLRRDGLRADARLRDGRLSLFCGSMRAEQAGEAPRPGFLPPLRLRVEERDFGFDLGVTAQKPVVLQGDRGLSQKGDAKGDASCYWSATRLFAQGSVRVGEQDFAVQGGAWCDREWSTSTLSSGQCGWDWFALQFEDGSELMWYRLRRDDGAPDRHSQGLWVRPDGSSERLLSRDVECLPEGSWTAADGRATYPAAFRLRVARLGVDLVVRPRLPDQELHTLVRYWEGAVAAEGSKGAMPLRGLGFLEMTGYAR